MLRIVRSQPRTASLLSGNSVLRAVFGSGRPTPQRQFSVFGMICNPLDCKSAATRESAAGAVQPASGEDGEHGRSVSKPHDRHPQRERRRNQSSPAHVDPERKVDSPDGEEAAEREEQQGRVGETAPKPRQPLPIPSTNSSASTGRTRAGTLLTATKTSGEITHISMRSRTGFSDIPHFNRTFRRFFGLSPSAYRASLVPDTESDKR